MVKYRGYNSKWTYTFMTCTIYSIYELDGIGKYELKSDNVKHCAFMIIRKL